MRHNTLNPQITKSEMHTKHNINLLLSHRDFLFQRMFKYTVSDDQAGRYKLQVACSNITIHCSTLFHLVLKRHLRMFLVILLTRKHFHEVSR